MKKLMILVLVLLSLPALSVTVSLPISATSVARHYTLDGPKTYRVDSLLVAYRQIEQIRNINLIDSYEVDIWQSHKFIGCYLLSSWQQLNSWWQINVLPATKPCGQREIDSLILPTPEQIINYRLARYYLSNGPVNSSFESAPINFTNLYICCKPFDPTIAVTAYHRNRRYLIIESFWSAQRYSLIVGNFNQ